MALFPCTRCGQRFVGRAASFYPALLLGRTSEREKVRLCPPCSDEYLAALSPRLQEVDWTNPSLPLDTDRPACMVCKGPATGGAVFITHYLPGEDRGDFYGGVCDSCVPEARAILQLEPAPARGAPRKR